MKKLILAMTLASTVCSASAIAGEKMNDLEIAHSAYTAGNLDIRYAHLALAISENQSVRDFAQLMLRDHKAVNDEAVALLTKLDATPQDNSLSQALAEGAAEKRAELMSKSGKSFDCAYAQNELGYHQVVNQTVENKFIPNVTVEPLKDLLSNALVTFKLHEDHAADMVHGLNC